MTTKKNIYTYADLSNFHRTVLAILSHNMPSKLEIEDLEIVQQYLSVVTALIDTTEIHEEFYQKPLYFNDRLSSGSQTTKIKGLNTICKLKKCLKALLIWMRGVLTIENLTLEILLEEYYTKFPYALKPPAA